MVRITSDLIDAAAQFTNTCGDREIDLRDNKVQVIENLGATRDLFDTIDLSNNEIRELDGFPLLKNLRTIIINNNRLTRVGDKVAETCPNVTELVLTNNNIAEFRELKKLSNFKDLTHISLLKNPVSKKDHYRKFLLHHNRKLRVIDFSRVKKKEREEAEALFASAEGAKLNEQLQRSAKSEAVAKRSAAQAVAAASKSTHTAQQTQAIKAAIAAAKSLEEVKKIERDLLAGKMPNPTPAPEVEMKA